LKYQLQVLKVHKIILVSILVSYRMNKKRISLQTLLFPLHVHPQRSSFKTCMIKYANKTRGRNMIYARADSPVSLVVLICLLLTSIMS